MWTINKMTSLDEIICWTESGTEFNIKNPIRFTDEVLPQFFRHNNFSSFIRQLNMYDFHKYKGSDSETIFKHPLFRRNEPSLFKKRLSQNDKKEV